MPAPHPRIRALAVGAGAVALLVVAVGGTVAASNPPTLYACYDVYGNVRVTDINTCKLPGGGRLVAFNTVGPTGPTGPTGPAGIGRVWTTTVDCMDTPKGGTTKVAELVLDAGSYYVSATGGAYDDNGGCHLGAGSGTVAMSCYLQVNYPVGPGIGGATDININDGTAIGPSGSIAVSGTTTLLGRGFVDLVCYDFDGSDNVAGVVLSALQVSQVTTQ